MHTALCTETVHTVHHSVHTVHKSTEGTVRLFLRLLFLGLGLQIPRPPLFARFRDRRVVREHQTAGQLQLVKQKGVGQLRHADRVDQMVRGPDVRQHLKALVSFSW